MKHPRPKVWISDVPGDRLGTRNLWRPARKSTRNKVLSWEPQNDLRNFQCRPNSAYYIWNHPEAWDPNDVLFLIGKRVWKSFRCLLLLVAFGILSMRFFQINAPFVWSNSSPFSCPAAIHHENPFSKSVHNTDSLHQKYALTFFCCRAISHSSRALRRVGPMKLLLALVPQLAAAIVVGSLPEGSDGLPVASGHRPGWLARSGRSVVWFGYWIDA